MFGTERIEDEDKSITQYPGESRGEEVVQNSGSGHTPNLQKVR